jgi:pimeloyl-ACP methyl ester carboxylesterase
VSTVSAPEETAVEVNGYRCRVWRKGSGKPLGILAGMAGMPRWTRFADRLSEHRTVVVPSLPGFPGADGHRDLDTHLDWLLATHDLLAGAGLAGADLVGISVGGALAADVAAVWPAMVDRLVLVSPFGLFDEAVPSGDPFAYRPGQAGEMLCATKAHFDEFTARPQDADPVEWTVVQTRAMESAARILWPIGDTGLARRLHRITSPTLLVWGEQDAVLPTSYADRFAGGIAGPSEIAIVPGAGHLADLDAPEKVAEEILKYLG